MRRPKIIINCAMTADGKLAMPDGARLRISSEPDLARVHRMRNRCDAILVGINTVLKDDPSLLVKPRFVARPRHPMRVVLDSKGRIPSKARVLDTRARTLVAVTKGKEGRVRKRVGGHVEVKAFGKAKVDLRMLMSFLHRSGVRSVMVEGGGEVIWSFISDGLLDEMTIFVGHMVVGGRGPTLAHGKGASKVKDVVPLDLVSVRRLGGGLLLRYRPGPRKKGK